MGTFYFTLLKISLNNSFNSRFYLFFSDYDVIKDIFDIHCERNNKEQIHCKKPRLDIERISTRAGIVEDYGDSISIQFNGKRSFPCHCSFQSSSQKKCIAFMDGYAVSLFLYCLNTSPKYVERVTKHMSYKLSSWCRKCNSRLQSSKLTIRVTEPQRHVMDLLWAKMACNTIHERRLLQYAMSWLSTLGGAFSALGEEQERCAKAAGEISIEQLRIALKLGDEIVITQCKLYFTLSLIQRGYCKRAKYLILEQYNNLKNNTVPDRKTINMCKGIWARLKYELQKRRKLKGSTPYKSQIQGCLLCKSRNEQKYLESKIT